MGKSKGGSKTSATEKLNSNANRTGRPRPMTPKAGYTQSRRRYSNGGDLCW